ncbi:hypothetical protein CYMTET_6677 [Cymbomonas tetramitiformis]|uniref:Uncharacterized protein n=1 Tax=Cymbomonas tetramitiformis TaxID=36881 RepID=A0AAE0GWQ9_9CHLO|nr:hypothetical protein CYMTET_6677 [Cymbomonas tetramitiformis]
MVKLSAELKLDNEKALREKDRELEDAKAAIDNKKKKKKKKKEKEKKKKKRKSKECLSSDDDSTSSKSKRRRPVVSEDDDEEEEEKENNEDPVQQTEDDVNERFKAAAGTKQMVDILKATKKFPATWDKAQPNMGLTRPALIKHMEQLVSARMEKLSAKLKLNNEKALREKDRELEDAKAAIDKKKKKEKEKKKKKRKSKEGISSDESTIQL